MPSTTNYPGGFANFGGMPILGTGPIATTGDVFFVDATDDRASAGASAGSRHTPFSTVQAAINRCTANQGDYVFVLPGHTEIIDGDISLNVAGITVMGLGVGMSRPTFDFLAAGDTIELAAPNCRVSNIICSLNSSATTVTTAFTFESDSDGGTIDNTRIMPHGSRQFTNLCDVGGGAAAALDDVTIAYNSWYTLLGASSADGIAISGASDRIHVIGNLVYGHFTNHAIGSTAANLDAMIVKNIFRNGNTSMCIDMHNSATGFAAYNAFASGASAITQDTGYDFGGMGCSENFMVNLVTETAGIIPTGAAT
jgi:hypothetical protein